MTEKPETWKKTSSRQIADCRVFKVREDVCERHGEQGQATFFVIENPDWVNIIALTKDTQVVLIEQFRHGTEETVLEIPGGMVDQGEQPAKAARRELREETGFTSDEFVLLGRSRPNPAIQNNWIYHYAAFNCEKNAKTSFDENESITTKIASMTEIDEYIERGDISHSLVLTAFYRYKLKYAKPD